MPFVTPSKRISLDNKGTIEVPGDLCYVIYKRLMRVWKDEPRWTTAHEMYKLYMSEMTTNWLRDWSNRTRLTHADLTTAAALAWQVFFHKHVMDYENKKIIENGEIE